MMLQTQPQSITAYFSTMQKRVSEIVYDPEKDALFARLLKNFNELMKLGLSIETSWSPFEIREMKKKLEEKTPALFSLIPTTEIEVNSHSSLFYRLDSEPLLKLAEIYYEESEKLSRGEYQYRGNYRFFSGKMDEEDRTALQSRLNSIKPSIDRWTPILRPSPSSLQREESPSVVTPPPAPKFNWSEFHQFVSLILRAGCYYHQQRLRCLCLLLLTATTPEFCLAAVQKQRQLKQENRCQFFVCRWFHRAAWCFGNDNYEKSWKSRSKNDHYDTILESFLTRLSAG
ncbi:MAG: hypothetical protein A3F41_04905 [Coxiella sp. RIFCSPHIGHO2_12_FULL_44_14]|nr:MAG: hypothetical protein A3F41_04905 [Coxiella sp. RIFCSPHIGHO2_12_FULL_44_14]